MLMIGAAGIGKTAYWLYPCIEYACASGMSFLSTDTKGDVMRNYGNIAKQYGYNVSPRPLSYRALMRRALDRTHISMTPPRDC